MVIEDNVHVHSRFGPEPYTDVMGSMFLATNPEFYRNKCSKPSCKYQQEGEAAEKIAKLY